jgi:hypothetical protein
MSNFSYQQMRRRESRGSIFLPTMFTSFWAFVAPLANWHPFAILVSIIGISLGVAWFYSKFKK